MSTPTERKLLKKWGYSKTEQVIDPSTGLVSDLIEGPLQKGGTSKITMRPADQTRAGLSRQLMDRAFVLPLDKGEREDLFAAIRSCMPRRVTQYALSNGWSSDGGYFVMGERVIGSALESQRGLAPEVIASSHRLAEAGTLDEWKRQVAGPAAYSSAMVIAIAAGLAAPLLKPLGMASMAFCLSGPSRSGKTVATKVGASVAGWSGDQPLPTWDMTDAAMDGLLNAANDLPLPIDDMMTLEGTDTGRLRRVDRLGYKLASERGRARHRSYEREHGVAGTWRTIALTSNEKPLAELSRTYKRPQGATVRLIDVPIILQGNDIFDRLHDATPAQRTTLLGQIAAVCRSQHGTAIVAFLKNLLSEPDVVKSAIDRHMVIFTAKVAHFSDGDLARDLTRKFALLYAAARFASTIGVVDWSEGCVEEALTRAYRGAREQISDEGKLLRDGCATLLRELRKLPRTTQMAYAEYMGNSSGYRYQTASHHHCWLRNEAFDRLFTRPQRELVERWLIQEGRLELAPSRRTGARGSEVKKQHPWMGDRKNRVRAVHIMWPRQRQQSNH